MQRTLILFKPDCVHRRLVGAILERFEKKGLRLVGLKLLQATRALAEKHYAVHKERPFYESLLTFLTGSFRLELLYGVTLIQAIFGIFPGLHFLFLSLPGLLRLDHGFFLGDLRTLCVPFGLSGMLFRFLDQRFNFFTHHVFACRLLDESQGRQKHGG